MFHTCLTTKLVNLFAGFGSAAQSVMILVTKSLVWEIASRRASYADIPRIVDVKKQTNSPTEVVEAKIGHKWRWPEVYAVSLTLPPPKMISLNRLHCTGILALIYILNVDCLDYLIYGKKSIRAN